MRRLSGLLLNDAPRNTRLRSAGPATFGIARQRCSPADTAEIWFSKQVGRVSKLARRFGCENSARAWKLAPLITTAEIRVFSKNFSGALRALGKGKAPENQRVKGPK